MNYPTVKINISHFSVGWWVTFKLLCMCIGYSQRYFRVVSKICVQFQTLLWLQYELCLVRDLSALVWYNFEGVLCLSAPAGPDAWRQAKTSARPRLRPTHSYTPLLPAHNNLLPPTYFSLQSLSETGTSYILCKWNWSNWHNLQIPTSFFLMLWHTTTLHQGPIHWLWVWPPSEAGVTVSDKDCM